MKRIFALLLAALLLLPALISCNKPPAGPADTSSAETTAPAESPDPTDRKNAMDSIPDTFSMNGATVGVLTRNTYRAYDWDGGALVDSDVMAQAVRKRTDTVQERLQVRFETTELELGWSDYGTAVEENILAGDDTWDIILAASNSSLYFGRDYLFQDVSDLQYLDLRREWWFTDAMNNISLDGKTVRYMIGDIVMNTYYYTTAAFFNKRIYEDNFGNPDDLYKLAIDKGFTYDKVMEMTEAAANDVNGNGLLETGDTFGFFIDNALQLDFMDYSSDLAHYTRDENGIPKVEYDLERGVAVLEKIYKLLNETPGSDLQGSYYTKHRNASGGIFTDGQVLFYVTTLAHTSLDHFRNMADDYGILPVPLIDENQKEYRSVITNSSTFVTIPVTCQNPEPIGAVIEALCSESYRSVVEVFFESALKAKYSRDSYSGKSIDIIREAANKDFLYEYGNQLGCHYLIRKCVAWESTNLASMYAEEADAANQKLTDLIGAIKNAEAGKTAEG